LPFQWGQPSKKTKGGKLWGTHSWEICGGGLKINLKQDRAATARRRRLRIPGEGGARTSQVTQTLPKLKRDKDRRLHEKGVSGRERP